MAMLLQCILYKEELRGIADPNYRSYLFIYLSIHSFIHSLFQCQLELMQLNLGPIENLELAV